MIILVATALMWQMSLAVDDQLPNRGLTTPQHELASCLNTKSIIAGGTCMDKYLDIKHILRPTQGVVGWAYVMHEVSKLSSEKLAQEWYDKNHIPVVAAAADNNLGYVLYVVDHHHHTSGLDYTGYNIDITFEILCDYRELSQDEFWDRMIAASLVYLGVRNPDSPVTLPSLISPQKLPKSFNFKSEGSDFIDDTFRSLAGFAKHLKDKDFCAEHGMNNDDCNRCFEMICNEQGGGIPFYEFRWGYFYSDALSNPTLWHNDTAYKIFNQAFSKFEYPAFPKKTNVDEWVALARLLIPLCRSSAAIDYTLRSDMFPRVHGRPSLPGYYPGLIAESDPDCSAKDMNCYIKGTKGRSELEVLSFMTGVGVMPIFWFGLIAVIAGFVFYVLRRSAKNDEIYDLVI